MLGSCIINFAKSHSKNQAFLAITKYLSEILYGLHMKFMLYFVIWHTMLLEVGWRKEKKKSITEIRKVIGEWWLLKMNEWMISQPLDMKYFIYFICSWDRFWIHHCPEQDDVVTENEWIKCFVFFGWWNVPIILEGTEYSIVYVADEVLHGLALWSLSLDPSPHSFLGFKCPTYSIFTTSICLAILSLLQLRICLWLLLLSTFSSRHWIWTRFFQTVHRKQMCRYFCSQSHTNTHERAWATHIHFVSFMVEWPFLLLNWMMKTKAASRSPLMTCLPPWRLLINDGFSAQSL